MSTTTETETFREKFTRLEIRVRERAAQQNLDMEPYTKALVDRTLRPVRRKPEELTPEEYDAANWRIMRHFGKANSGDPDAANNERIDADLAREYGNNHEDQA